MDALLNKARMGSYFFTKFTNPIMETNSVSLFLGGKMFNFVKTLFKYVMYYLIVTLMGVGLSYLFFGREEKKGGK